MSYSNELFSRAQRVLEKRRDVAENAALMRTEEITSKIPEIAEIQNKLAKIGIEISKVIFYKDAPQRFEEIKKNSQSLVAKRNKLLIENGYSEDVLSPDYTCKACEDRGYIDSRMCSCMKQVLKDLMKQEVLKFAPLDKCTFETFDIKKYPEKAYENGIIPAERATKILDAARKYAQNFSKDSKNILFLGATGLGKTHLSLAIANVVINKGYSVCYGSSQNICEDLKSESYGRNENISYTKKQVLESDLLILDDLGCEIDSNFNTSTIYNIINSRILSSRPTIISTNYEITELLERYDQRVSSRLTGEYTKMILIGKDIRNNE